MTLSKPLKILLTGLALMLLLGGIAYLLAVNGAQHGALVIDDIDLSDSVAGWLIAVPVLLTVGVLLAVIFAGVGVIVIGAVSFAMVVAALAMLLAFLPFFAFLAIPLLVIYGLVKLFSRPAGTGTAT
jgi:hypothetical protein